MHIDLRHNLLCHRSREDLCSDTAFITSIERCL